MSVKELWQAFCTYNANAFYTICYFIKHNAIYLVVIVFIAYMLFTEIQDSNYSHVDDQRKIT